MRKGGEFKEEDLFVSGYGTRFDKMNKMVNDSKNLETTPVIESKLRVNQRHPEHGAP